MSQREERINKLKEEAQRRILILDGPMGHYDSAT
jgi:methionine synthase I (cobalamin-dependent)